MNAATAASIKTRFKMKELFIIIIIASPFCLLAQKIKSEKIVKVGKIFMNQKLSYYYENDKKGNCIFTKNDGMNGPITMLFESEYDTLNRETRTYSAHSNIGFSVSETVYQTNRILHYGHFTDSGNVNSYERSSLNKVQSKKQFLRLEAIQQLLRAEKRLVEIEVLDSSKNVIAEIYFSEKGDTSTVNTRHYNSSNKQILFNFGVRNNEPWIWDIFFRYDNKSNLIKSIRLTPTNGVKDTTEITSYCYNGFNLLTSETYYYKKEFRNKTQYIYNKNHKILVERYYEGDKSKLSVVTLYKYKNGILSEKIQRDFRNSKKDLFTYQYTYW
jgi:hypothetical protein